MYKVFALIGNELLQFTELSDAIKHYPMLIVKDNILELLNVRPQWKLVSDTKEKTYRLMDIRSEVRKVEDIETLIRNACRFTDWEEYDKVQIKLKFNSVERKVENYTAQLRDTLNLLSRLATSLRVAEQVNTIGGPGSRKQVTDILDKSILEVNQTISSISNILSIA